MSEELTSRQIEQQDAVDSEIEELLRTLSGHDIEHDIELIGIVRDAVQEVLCDRLHLMTEMEFYPYIQGNQEETDTRNAMAVMIVRCIVAATNAGGEPDLYHIKVRCSRDEYFEGCHYVAAKHAALEMNYDPLLVYDEYDTGGGLMLGIFNWDKADTIGIDC